MSNLDGTDTIHNWKAPAEPDLERARNLVDWYLSGAGDAWERAAFEDEVYQRVERAILSGDDALTGESE